METLIQQQQTIQSIILTGIEQSQLPQEIAYMRNRLQPDRIFGKQLRPFIKPLYTNLVTAAMDGYDVEALSRSTQIYFLLCSYNTMQWNNWDNNDLLALSAIQAAATGKLPFWRFVCLPYVELERDASAFVSWKYSIGSRRYDTLNPALRYDKKLLASCEQIGIQPTLTFVFDDWEALFLRCRGSYELLSKQDKQTALERLEEVRAATTQWIAESVQGRDIAYNTLFFSQLIGYQEFCDLMDSFQLDMQARVINEEARFIKEASKDITETQAQREAHIRVSQYATEGALLQDQGIFLPAEYPITLVYTKLSLINKFASCFYVRDEQIKNM